MNLACMGHLVIRNLNSHYERIPCEKPNPWFSKASSITAILNGDFFYFTNEKIYKKLEIFVVT